MFGRDNLKDGKKIKSVRNEKGWKKNEKLDCLIEMKDNMKEMKKLN